MTSDEVADEVEYLQGRVTADMIKSYCGRGSQSLRGNSLPKLQSGPIRLHEMFIDSSIDFCSI